jgi:hypothetical protein
MEHALVCHPSGSLAQRALGLAARVEWAGAGLEVGYRLQGDLSGIRLPAAAVSQRAERLWEHTCFELFLAPAGRDDYRELNFSPSTEWAAYTFDRYRQGMRELILATPPTIAVERRPRELNVTVSMDLLGLADAPLPWRVNLAAVVQDATGQNSYWALRHPQPKPDFHAAEGFSLRLEGSAR